MAAFVDLSGGHERIWVNVDNICAIVEHPHAFEIQFSGERTLSINMAEQEKIAELLLQNPLVPTGQRSAS